MSKQVRFQTFIEAFEKKLEAVVINEKSDELYCRKYLSHLLLHKKYYLSVYADVFNKLIHVGAAPAEISVLDYGAGNGLLGIFAKFCGFKKVWINDVDLKFIGAAEKLAAQLSIPIDGFITGDIGAVKKYFIDEIPSAVIGTDVIEHIYNLGEFFTSLQKINPALISVFTSASNPANYFKVRQLKKIQRKDELEGGNPGDHILFGDKALPPFLEMRRSIIRKYRSGLSADEIQQLAITSRGLNVADITSAVDEYKRSGNYPKMPAGTNTCNPLTGSWTERILPFETYTSLYNAADFTCKIYPGFYNDKEGFPSNFVKKLLNAIITITGKKISPYIVLVGHGNQ